jgi:cardiolipin synthase
MFPALETIHLAPIVKPILIAVHFVVIVGLLLARRRDPSATLAWVLFIVALPVVGALIYLLFGRTRVRHAAKRSRVADARVQQILSHCDVQNQWLAMQKDTRTSSQISLGNSLASMPASHGNTVRILGGATATYSEIIEEIEGAIDHIHVEFYIIQPDQVGKTLRDHLVLRAAEGIEVRVLCDAIGSMALPLDFWRPLHNAGGKAVYFRPVLRLIPRLRRRDRVDLRNHRKVVVIDGRVGFTGGINVGKEYLGLNPKIGHWRDTHIRIEGPAVLSLQETFLHDWLMTTPYSVDDKRYFPQCSASGEDLVQIIDSGPDQSWAVMEMYYAQAIASSHQRVWITNPYFIPSPAIETALVVAGLRGVDVRLLLPARSDSLLVSQASRSYYEELLAAGVRIFEYQRGFVHAKTMVVDSWIATVGSANMDMRSFNLNFELNAFVFSGQMCQDLAAHFLEDLEAASEVTMELERKTGLSRRLLRSTARLLSPLL